MSKKKKPNESTLANTNPLAIDIGISEQNRQQINEGLRHLLADTFTLYLMTHQFHWNVTGPMFSSLHNLFMAQYTELWNAVDPIAERLRALGFEAPGSYAAFQQLTCLPSIEQRTDAFDMVRALVHGHEQVAKTARAVFTVADDANDQPTADLMTQRLDTHEKTAWMLRSILQ